MRNLRRCIGAAAVPLLVMAGSASLVGTAHALPALPSTGSVITSSGTDSDVSFEADGTTFHGSLRTPDGEIRGAALLLPGSGPSDRNGNQAPFWLADTLSRTADSLAAQGIASLRFDKIGAGATGLGTYTPETIGEYGFTDQVDHAEAAARRLAELTGVSTDDILVLGHSEGGLTTLALAQRGIGSGYGLLAPLSVRYLDLLTDQFEAAVAAGRIDEASAAVLRTELPATVEHIRATGTVPEDQDPLLEQFGLSAANAKFLYEADRLDPVELAAEMAPDTPVLLTCSDQDIQITCGQVEPLRAALEHTDLQFEHFTTANHALEELGPFPAGTTDIALLLPPSTEFATAINGWSAARAK